MFKPFFIALSAILLSFSVFATETATDSDLPEIEEGNQYMVIPKSPSLSKEVVEFFSFNCPACYRLDTELKAAKTIKENLPEGVVFKKYNLSSYGQLATELSEAWAIANVLGIADEVTIDLYHGIQGDRTIKTADDIKTVFANFGVDETKFENMKNNYLVKAFIAQQEKARRELQPISIPSFYVNSKYRIYPEGLNRESNEAFIKDYSRVINYLSQLNVTN